MAIDTSPDIKNWNLASPAKGDNRNEGAGQMRAIKIAVNNCLPEFAGPMTYSNTQVNNVCNAILGSTTSTEAVGAMPLGGIIMWSGAVVNIPTGWALCDGQVSNNVTTPDMSGKFIVGYDENNTDYDSVGKTGGSDELIVNPKVDESTNYKTEGHGLTPEQLAEHTHLEGSHSRVQWANETNMPDGWEVSPSSGNGSAEHHEGPGEVKAYTAPAGDGEEHTHDILEQSLDNRPSYYTIAYIMFVGVA